MIVLQDKNAFGAEFIDYSYAGTVWGRLFDEKRNLVYEGNMELKRAREKFRLLYLRRLCFIGITAGRILRSAI